MRRRLLGALLLSAAVLTGCGGGGVATDPNETRLAEFLADALMRTDESARIELCSDLGATIDNTVEALGGNPDFDDLSEAQIRDVATRQFDTFCK